MEITKALSIKQPWAHLIATGIKDIENRSWKTNLRGTVYIHASGKLAKAQTGHCLLDTEQVLAVKEKGELELIKFLDEDYLKSAIIGQVEIIDCVQNHSSIWAEKAAPGEKPIWNWVLSNPQLYEKPILKIKGKLSFWAY